MMLSIHDDLTERFKSFIDDDGMVVGDQLQVTLYDGRMLRFQLEAIETPDLQAMRDEVVKQLDDRGLIIKEPREL